MEKMVDWYTMRDRKKYSQKTFNNERFGFLINYPKDWILRSESINGDGRDLYNEKAAVIAASATV